MAENGVQSAERLTSGTLDDAERAGPIATALTKRMRWANKRMEKISRTEEKARAQPDKPLNEDQVNRFSASDLTQRAFALADMFCLAAFCTHACVLLECCLVKVAVASCVASAMRP